MTDTVNIHLDLAKLSEAARRKIPAQHNFKRTTVNDHEDSYSTPFLIDGPYPGTRIKVLVKCEVGTHRTDLLPSSIEAEVHVPNATCGHNLVHGTSTYAAGTVAFEILRRWLARQGISECDLDMVTIDDAKLLGVTVTYLFTFESPQRAIDVVDHIHVVAKALVTDQSNYETTNKTITMNSRDFTVTAYIKTNFKHVQKEALTDSLKERNSRTVRIEAKLRPAFLEKHSLVRVKNWQEGYRDGLYRQIFGLTVMEILRLDGHGLRHRKVTTAALDKVSEKTAELLQLYFDGGDIRAAPHIQTSANPDRAYRDLANKLEKDFLVDVSIPWSLHQKMRHTDLKKLLVYPDDLTVIDPDLASRCFVKSNLDEILQRLYQAEI